MNKLVLASALALFPVVAYASDLPAKGTAPKAPAKSTSLFDGFIGGDFGHQSTSHSFTDGVNELSFDDAGNTYGAHGSFSTMFSPQYGVQLDADFRHATHDIESDALSFDANTPTVAGHLFWRDSSTGLLGAFAQYSTTSNMLVLGDVYSLGMERSYFGLDGQFFFGDLTFYGQAAVADSSLSSNLIGGDIGADGYVITGQVRYFVDPNMMISLRASYTKSTFSAEGSDILDVSTTSIGARAEYRLAGNPISVYADVSKDMNEASIADGVFLSGVDNTRDETRFMLGANINFGGSSLKERDRSGASLNPIEPPHSPLVFWDFFPG